MQSPPRYSDKKQPIRDAYRRGGPAYVVRRAAARAANTLKVLLTPLMKRPVGRRTFRFEDVELHYEVHAANATWSNERALEVAIARHLTVGVDIDDMMEIGAVLGQYLPDDARPRLIVDKYDAGPGTTTQDLLAFVPSDGRKFDLVLSISTLEHFGVDEHDHPDQPERALAAMEHIRTTLVSPAGRAIIIVPFGYNRCLDSLMLGHDNIEGVRLLQAYRRTSRLNRWRSCDRSELDGADYGDRYATASGLGVLEVRVA